MGRSQCLRIVIAKGATALRISSDVQVKIVVNIFPASCPVPRGIKLLFFGHHGGVVVGNFPHAVFVAVDERVPPLDRRAILEGKLVDSCKTSSEVESEDTLQQAKHMPSNKNQ